jgi:hypothetical protein
MSGEMILSISYGLIMVAGGGFVWWQVKRYFERDE